MWQYINHLIVMQMYLNNYLSILILNAIVGVTSNNLVWIQFIDVPLDFDPSLILLYCFPMNQGRLNFHFFFFLWLNNSSVHFNFCLQCPKFHRIHSCIFYQLFPSTFSHDKYLQQQYQHCRTVDKKVLKLELIFSAQLPLQWFVFDCHYYCPTL